MEFKAGNLARHKLTHAKASEWKTKPIPCPVCARPIRGKLARHLRRRHGRSNRAGGPELNRPGVDEDLKKPALCSTNSKAEDPASVPAAGHECIQTQDIDEATTVARADVDTQVEAATAEVLLSAELERLKAELQEAKRALAKVFKPSSYERGKFWLNKVMIDKKREKILYTLRTKVDEGTPRERFAWTPYMIVNDKKTD